MGSRCGPIDKAQDLLDIGVDGTKNQNLPPLRVEKYITKTFSLANAVDAIQCAAEKTTMKVQIICSDEGKNS